MPVMRKSPRQIAPACCRYLGLLQWAKGDIERRLSTPGSLLPQRRLRTWWLDAVLVQIESKYGESIVTDELDGDMFLKMRLTAFAAGPPRPRVKNYTEVAGAPH